MDVRDPKWYGQLQIPGVGAPKNREGTIMKMLMDFIADIQEQNARNLSSTNKQIVIRLDILPFGKDKAGNTQADKLAEVMAGIDDSNMTRNPNPDESYEDYYQFLRDKGLNHLSAAYIAGDWFDKPAMEDLENWMADEKAIRFRLLNGNKEVFDSAHPMEYEQLKHYVIHTFPQFAENITFRTA